MEINNQISSLWWSMTLDFWCQLKYLRALYFILVIILCFENRVALQIILRNFSGWALAKTDFLTNLTVLRQREPRVPWQWQNINIRKNKNLHSNIKLSHHYILHKGSTFCLFNIINKLDKISVYIFFITPSGAQGVTLSVCLSVHPSVRLAKVCLKHWIFIFIS